MDITDEVNDLITGGTPNNGYGLSFDYETRKFSYRTSTICWFFLRHTQTYYEPFLETVYDNPIKDNRKISIKIELIDYIFIVMLMVNLKI